MPQAIPIIAVAASVVGTGVAAYGQMQSANAASAAASYKAKIDQQNQLLANNAAANATAQGLVEQQEKANQTNQLIGRQKAASAGNGVDVDSGSAVDLQSDAAAAGELDQLTIASNAQRESIGYTNQGLNYADQAQMDQASSQNDLSAGALGAASTVLSGAGSVASHWYSMQFGTRQSNPI